MSKPFILGWWSAGITSAVACKIALDLYKNVELYYIHIDTAHPDNDRFKADCEDWYKIKIKTLKSKTFKDQFEVIKNTRLVNTPTGARCTFELKKKVRIEFEKRHQLTLTNTKLIKHQVWGYEFDKVQVNRAIRHLQQYRETNPLFPLIEKGITKNMAAGMLEQAGIELPIMYKMGYQNNNCIACVKGSSGYWNKIRRDFPEYFNKMANLEIEIGNSCISGTFLKELHPYKGKMKTGVMPDCGVLCEVEFAHMPDRNLGDILAGRKSIYEV